jgi:hypothetical protein
MWTTLRYSATDTFLLLQYERVDPVERIYI